MQFRLKRSVARYMLSIATAGALIILGTVILILHTPGGCTRPDSSPCQYRSIEKYLDNQDIPGALNTIASYSVSDPDLRTCHALMHLVGGAAYKQYEQGRPFVFTEQANMCSYGFFHGFMEALLATTHDYGEATAVCTGRGKTSFNIPREQCFHGIGHGMVDQHTPSAWKNVPGVLSASIALCKGVMATQNDFDKCIGGAYNGIANAYWLKEYGLTPDLADPFSLCRIATENRGDCYAYMARVLLDEPPYTFASAVRFIRATVPEKYQSNVISGIATMSSPRGNDQTGMVHVCESLPQSLSSGCIVGLAQGIMYSGDVKSKIYDATALCKQADESLRAECTAAVTVLASKQVFSFSPPSLMWR